MKSKVWLCVVEKREVYKLWLILAMNQWLRKKIKGYSAAKNAKGAKKILFIFSVILSAVKDLKVCATSECYCSRSFTAFRMTIR
jgi:hypothetical protein